MRFRMFLLLIGASTSLLKADYINVALNSGTYGVGCGSITIDPGEPCAYSPNVPSTHKSVDLATSAGMIKGEAYAAYGVNKVFAQTSGTEYAQASSEWMVSYSVNGLPLGTPVNLTVNIGFDAFVSTSGPGEAGFRIVLNNESLVPLMDIFTTTNGFGGDSCYTRPGSTLPGACAGAHGGILSRTVTAYAGMRNLMTLNVGARAYGPALSDGYHTAWVDSIIVPDGVTWSYSVQSGNPLQFQYSQPSTAVPEPSGEAAFAAGAVGAMLILARLKLGHVDRQSLPFGRQGVSGR
ncbi:hypothetical protein F183_A17720 [Bryobacterales bacterium F-183]|nr:hypothetical protein F183_A17720 [Bryobacterales bacterium F-183]